MEQSAMRFTYRSQEKRKWRRSSQKVSHFVLVHGSCHGAWCWYKLIKLLKSAGHRVTAIDLAASGINLEKVEDLKIQSDYLQPLMDFMEGLPAEEKVILVGHSMGGVAVSVAMEKYPNNIAVAVFATAYMQGPELSMVKIGQFSSELAGDAPMDVLYAYDDGKNNNPTAFLFGDEYMQNRMYQNSPPENLELAYTLVRSAPNFPDKKSIEETMVSSQKYGSVPRVFIKSGMDKGITPPLQRYMIENNPPDEVKEISDSDHMLMLSKPVELCSYLLEIAAKYN